MDQSKIIDKTRTSLVKIKVDTKDNLLLKKVVDLINENREIKTLWKITNVIATDRLGYSDHGPVHFNIVAGYALRILRLLDRKGVEMSVVKDFGLTKDHAEVIVFLASVLHDLGMSIHRSGHEQFSLFLANSLLKDLLSFMDIEERTVVISETLHAIISHSHGSSGRTATVEGGIVRVADALDMTKGRARISKLLVDIENVSNNAIDSVFVNEGDQKLVDIKITMTNPAGLFQVDDFVEEKLDPSGLKEYIDVKTYIIEDGKEKLFKDYD
ncbi:MAG: HD domain-containing protein [bacterium]|nr:MAG: HD domain-containing protein [bacterium]